MNKAICGWRTRSIPFYVCALGVCFAMCFIGGLTNASSAFACKRSKSEEEHCYSLATLEDEGEPVASEIGGYIVLGCIGLENPPNNFNTDEMWASMANASWIEGGIVTGITAEKEGTYYPEPHFFIAYNHKNTEEFKIKVGSEAPAMTANLVYLEQAVPNKSKTWYGWTAGTGTITAENFGNSTAATSAEVGLESTQNGGWNDAAFTGLGYLQPSGNVFVSEWKYTGHNAIRELIQPSTEPKATSLYFDWEQQNYEADFGQNNHGC